MPVIYEFTGGPLDGYSPAITGIAVEDDKFLEVMSSFHLYRSNGHPHTRRALLRWASPGRMESGRERN